MKVLYISQYFPPEMGAPAARASELSRRWTEAGHEVTVLTGFPNHPTGVIPPEYRLRYRRLVSRERVNGVNVVRTWLLPFPNRKPAERMLNYSSFFLSAALTGCFLSKPEVVIGSSPQLLVGLAAWWIARKHRARFVFEVRDLWPESLVAVGMGKEGSILHRGLASIVSFLYKHSDHIVVVTPAFGDHLVERWQVPSQKISVIENGVEPGFFENHPGDDTLRRHLGWEDKFVVSYIGTLGMAHALDTVIEAAARLRLNPKIQFLMVGEGADRERIEQLASSRGLQNLRFVGQQARAAIPAYICASDVCLVPLRKTALFKTVMPSKMLEFMACGRPVIVGVDGQARQIIEQSNAGIYVEPESASALVSAILRLANDRALRDRLGANGRRFVLEHFSRARKAQSYIDVLENLLCTAEKQSDPAFEAVS